LDTFYLFRIAELRKVCALVTPQAKRFAAPQSISKAALRPPANEFTFIVRKCARRPAGPQVEARTVSAKNNRIGQQGCQNQARHSAGIGAAGADNFASFPLKKRKLSIQLSACLLLAFDVADFATAFAGTSLAT
jgi:hypothetical protein